MVEHVFRKRATTREHSNDRLPVGAHLSAGSGEFIFRFYLPYRIFFFLVFFFHPNALVGNGRMTRSRRPHCARGHGRRIVRIRCFLHHRKQRKIFRSSSENGVVNRYAYIFSTLTRVRPPTVHKYAGGSRFSKLSLSESVRSVAGENNDSKKKNRRRRTPRLENSTTRARTIRTNAVVVTADEFPRPALTVVPSLSVICPVRWTVPRSVRVFIASLRRCVDSASPTDWRLSESKLKVYS